MRAALPPEVNTALTASVRALASVTPGGLLGGLPPGRTTARATATSPSGFEFRTLRVLPEAVG